jgi:hypothetical protein
MNRCSISNSRIEKTILIAFLAFLSTAIKSQEAYLVRNDTVITGKKIIDAGEIENGMMVQIGNTKNPVIYSPEEVEEYGFKDGRKYFSRTVLIDGTERRVFLERLSKGKLTLYYLKDAVGRMIFVEKENEVPELMLKVNHKNIPEIRTTFDEYMSDCSNVNDAIALFKFNKRSITKLTQLYNNCETKPFPFKGYGIYAGLMLGTPGIRNNGLMEIINKSNFYIIESDGFLNINSFSGGLSADFPIFLSSFSISTGLDFSMNKYVYHSGNATINSIVPNTTALTIFDANINVASLSVPLMARVKFYHKRLIPYLNGGPLFSYKLPKYTEMYSTRVDKNIIKVEKLQNPEFNFGAQAGFTIGTGIQYKLYLKKSVSFDIRYNYLIGIEKNSMGIKYLQFMTGYNF